MIKWPLDILPAVLGLFQLFLMHPQASELFKVVEKGNEILFNILTHLKEKDLNVNIHLLALRCLTNFFRYPTGE
jgi:hypothetical protein